MFEKKSKHRKAHRLCEYFVPLCKSFLGGIVSEKNKSMQKWVRKSGERVEQKEWRKKRGGGGNKKT